jgi:hypothetical protein
MSPGRSACIAGESKAPRRADDGHAGKDDCRIHPAAQTAQRQDRNGQALANLAGARDAASVVTVSHVAGYQAEDHHG